MAQSKYNELNVKAFIDAVRMGVKIKHACQILKISQETYYTWIKDHPEFADAVKTAEGERIQEAHAIIRRAAVKSWPAAAWFLERTFPQDYGLRTASTLHLQSGNDEAAMKDRAKRISKWMNEAIETGIKEKTGVKPEHLNGNGNEPKSASLNQNGAHQNGNGAEMNGKSNVNEPPPEPDGGPEIVL